MKISTLALILAAFAFAPLTQAEDAQLASSPAACCKKASASENACTHGCCVTAAKENKNCEKCGGKNAPKVEPSM